MIDQDYNNLFTIYSANIRKSTISPAILKNHEIRNTMYIPPAWASDLPLNAETKSLYYTKNLFGGKNNVKQQLL